MLGGEGCRAIFLSCFPYSRGLISEVWENNNYERISFTGFFLPVYFSLRLPRMYRALGLQELRMSIVFLGLLGTTAFLDIHFLVT